MEKISVTPRSIRGLGNIVSPKTSDDFRGYSASISSDTDTVDNRSMTVYTEEYKAGTRITIDAPLSVDSGEESFTVGVTVHDDRDYCINGLTVYCSVNGTVQSGTSSSTGLLEFTVPVDETVSVYDVMVYFKGDSSFSGSFGTVKVYSDILVDDLNLYGDKSVIQSGDTCNLLCEVLDENDAPVKNAPVNIYYEKDNGTVYEDSTEQSVSNTSGHYAFLKIVELSDLPSSFTVSFDFKTSIESRVFLGAKDLININNPQYSVFVGSPDGSSKLYYGYRTTTTTSTDITSTPTSYNSMSISRNESTITYTIGGNTYTKSVDWLDNYESYILGLCGWGTGTVYIKNLKVVL